MPIAAMEDCPDRIFIESSGFEKLSDVVKVCTQLKEKNTDDLSDRMLRCRVIIATVMHTP